MGKPTGFLEHLRAAAPSVAPEKRVASFDEYVQPMPEETLRAQASRCMDCGVPFCQSATGCPLDNRVPEWNDLVFHGRWREALDRLHATNNFPEWTGRVCPAPCEGACVLGLDKAPVTIKSIECAIVDKGFEEGWIHPEPPPKRTGKRVAVVGSGPAGLAAAQQLNRAGHDVTVFERDDRAGGLLTYGIPNMKLDKRLVERRVGQLQAEGVRFETGVEVGKQLSPKKLKKDFDATLLAVGATRPRDLAVPGRELRGIHFAMELLTASTRHLLNGKRMADPGLMVKGRRVVVIGGGDTGTDCVGTALRLGAKSVTQLELLPRPPDERGEDNPWPQWPRVFKVDYGQEEAAARQGADPRAFAVASKAFVGDARGHVTGIEVVDVEWTPGPRPAMKPREGATRVIPAELVLLAMGFEGPEALLAGELDVERDARGTFAAAYGRYATSVPGVFAAGDCRRGQSLVVWAIAEGRGAARAIDEYLMGESDLPAPD